MSERPELSRDISAEVFRSYYYLKEELVKFCRKYDLQTSGPKQELTDRIAYFLETGKKKSASSKRIQAESIGEITENTLIEANIVCSEKHRAFFKERIGKTFSFNVSLKKQDDLWYNRGTGNHRDCKERSAFCDL